MLKKEDILKVLKKYGFYSLNRAPYLYQSDGRLGVYFVWPNKQYGHLERVSYFEDEASVEEAIFKYWWFTNNKDQYCITVEFDDYEIVNPTIIYKYKNCILTVEEMRNFSAFLEQYVDPKEELIRKQLSRSVTILLSLLKEKYKEQNETFSKVTEYSENLRTLTNTFYQKLKEYQRDKKEEALESEVLIDTLDDSEEVIKRLEEEFKMLTGFDEIRDFINTLAHCIKELDFSEAHFQNVYLLNRYPYEIQDVTKKIEVLNQQLKMRKKIFKSKKDALEELESIDHTSECNKMIPVELFIETEKKKVQEKYDLIKEVSEEFLGDYLATFLESQITLPPAIHVEGTIEEIDKKRLISTVKKAYEKLSETEKSACFVASCAILRECLHVLMSLGALNEININETISKIIVNQKIDLFNTAYQTLDYYTNAKLRVKYFSILKMNSFETFMLSLVDVARVLKKIEFKIDKSFFAYFTNVDKEVIPLYLKNVFYSSHKTSYIGIVHPETPFYYSPVEIVSKIDILDNTELLERESDTIFLLKEKIDVQRKPDKLVVVKFEKERLEHNKDYTVILQMKEKSRCNYIENVIYKKQGE
ncbi:MAG: hypothetical protein HFJ02_07140 [Bacilli bacterium]|nr:hypothetical protein [Bacilli bacterium]